MGVVRRTIRTHYRIFEFSDWLWEERAIYKVRKTKTDSHFVFCFHFGFLSVARQKKEKIPNDGMSFISTIFLFLDSIGFRPHYSSTKINFVRIDIWSVFDQNFQRRRVSNRFLVRSIFGESK